MSKKEKNARNARTARRLVGFVQLQNGEFVKMVSQEKTTAFPRVTHRGTLRSGV